MHFVNFISSSRQPHQKSRALLGSGVVPYSAAVSACGWASKWQEAMSLLEVQGVEQICREQICQDRFTLVLVCWGGAVFMAQKNYKARGEAAD